MKTPVVIEGDKIVYVDVDNTLIMTEKDIKAVAEDEGHFLEMKEFLGTVKMRPPAHQDLMEFYVNNENVELVKHISKMGTKIVVWSKSGYRWAAEAVEQLELEEFVDLIISKPNDIIDDLPAEKFIPKPMWKHPWPKAKF